VEQMPLVDMTQAVVELEVLEHLLVVHPLIRYSHLLVLMLLPLELEEQQTLQLELLQMEVIQFFKQ
jgi:hypothetical protein